MEIFSAIITMISIVTTIFTLIENRKNIKLLQKAENQQYQVNGSVNINRLINFILEVVIIRVLN